MLLAVKHSSVGAGASRSAPWPTPFQQLPPPCRLTAHLDFNVSRLALGTTQGLVNHDAAVGKAVPLALMARRQQEGTHGRCQAHAHGGHVGADVAHGVKHRHACNRGHICLSGGSENAAYFAL